MTREKTPVGAKVPPRLKDEIDEYKDQQEHTNRSDAIRELVEYGLEYEERPNGIVLTKPAALALIGWWLISIAWLQPQVDLIGPLGVATIVAAAVYAFLRGRM